MTGKSLRPVGLHNIHITDGFWRPYVDLISNVAIPYQWKILNNEIEEDEPSYCLQNYRIASGEEQGHHQGSYSPIRMRQSGWKRWPTA